MTGCISAEPHRMDTTTQKKTKQWKVMFIKTNKRILLHVNKMINNFSTKNHYFKAIGYYLGRSWHLPTNFKKKRGRDVLWHTLVHQLSTQTLVTIHKHQPGFFDILGFFFTSVWRNSDSYENKKRSARRDTLFVPKGMPTISW